MARRKSTGDLPETLDGTELVPIPTPPINLHDLEAVRREMARVYRDMRGGRIPTQDGTRLVYALGEIAKIYQASTLERRLAELEKLTHEHR